MRIESGPSGERKVRSSIMFLMLAGGGIWFAVDGLYKWPAANLKEFRQQLPLSERERAADAPAYDSVTAESLEAAVKAVQGKTLLEQEEALRALYGNPPSHKGSDAVYYFGPAFQISFPLENGKLGKPIPQKARHSPSDLWLQKLLAAMLGVAAHYAGWILFRVWRTRVVLDETGLTFRGRGAVKWEEMKALQTGSFAKKGLVDLICATPGGQRKIRLDEYHLAAFEDIIDEICDRRGFENPLPDDEDADAGGEPNGGGEDTGADSGAGADPDGGAA